MKIWIGRICTAVVGLALLLDASIALLLPQDLVHDVTMAGFLLACVVLYAIPRTAIIGTILVTVFICGEVISQCRADAGFSPLAALYVVLGLLVWTGLVLSRADVVPNSSLLACRVVWRGVQGERPGMATHRTR